MGKDSEIVRSRTSLLMQMIQPMDVYRFRQEWGLFCDISSFSYNHVRTFGDVGEGGRGGHSIWEEVTCDSQFRWGWLSH